MINGLEGIPGSGKSYEAVVYHVLPALQKGRLVITNLPLLVEMFAAVNPDYRDLIELRTRTQPIRGTWDAERVDEKGNGNAFELFEDGHTEKPDVKVSLFGHVWDYWSEWKHPKTGQGPLFIIDECHVGMPKLGTDPQVVEWYKLHRHFNADVLLGTQNFRDMNSSIAGLLAILIKVRKADILGKADHYIRKTHGGYRGGVVSTEERKYKPEFFKFYKSHTQGNSVAESAAQDMAPFLVKFNRSKWAVFAVGAVAVVWAFWPQPDTPKPAVKRPPAASLVQTSSAGQGVAKAVSDPVGTVTAVIGKQASDQPVGINEIPEPYGLKGLHVVGQITMNGKTIYVLAVSQNGVQITTVTSSELERIGYRWKALTDCAASLQWKEKVRALTCDSPQITMALQRTATTANQAVAQ
ncbi:zonula occludens toxin [Polaromonas sp. CF318]|uniref:zonular occludens toxin domain-containing protein n=1 Tax=Polaromonas sp. CF318 TaxID=1144318 RepID=UPI000270E33D|nr:zonular occludens toxin domain-containing protein [Polaromonas sp. CF318]EJL82440.1 zonula occludens toxin [Polaromonas sp. CF318]